MLPAYNYAKYILMNLIQQHILGKWVLESKVQGQHFLLQTLFKLFEEIEQFISKRIFGVYF